MHCLVNFGKIKKSDETRYRPKAGDRRAGLPGRVARPYCPAGQSTGLPGRATRLVCYLSHKPQNRSRGSSWVLEREKSTGQDRKKVTKGLYFTYLWRSPHWSDVNENLISGWCSRRNHVCQVSKWNFQVLRFYRGSNFPFSYWFLNGPYNSAALLRCLWSTGFFVYRQFCQTLSICLLCCLTFITCLLDVPTTTDVLLSDTKCRSVN